MLKTPETFVALIAAREHALPHNFIFSGDEILVAESDLALPNADALALLGMAQEQFLPVGMLGDIYCRTAWLPAKTPAPAGYQSRKLRSLFGAIDESLMAVAGRAFQLAE